MSGRTGRGIAAGPWILLLALAGAGAVARAGAAGDRPSAPGIETARVVRRDFERRVSGSGTIRPLRSADIVSYTPGRITRLWVVDGDRVEKGRRLLSIEGYYRVREGEEAGADRRPEAPDEGGAILKTAPMAGAVSLEKVAGSAVDAGEVVASVLDLDDLVAEVLFFGAGGDSIRRGQPALLTAPSGRFDGVVSSLSPRIDPASGGRRVGIEFHPPEPRTVLPGAFVRAEVVLGKHPAAPAVPAGAVVDDGQETVVFVREGPGFRRRAIETGLRDGAFVEVLGGLEPGEEVATAGAWELLHRGIAEKIKPED